MDNIKNSNCIAVVIPCFNESETIDELVKQLEEIFEDGDPTRSYKFLLVDDGSSDNTWGKILRISLQNSRVSGLRLSRNFGHQKALLAGLEYSLEFGDFIISMDADLQHPVSIAMEMLNQAMHHNYNIVLGKRIEDKHSSAFKRATSKLFYRVLNYLGAEIAPDVSDFRVMDKQAVSALVRHGDHTLFTRGIVSLIGFNQGIYPYRVAERFAGSSKYTKRKMFKFASEGIISLSVAPLRLTFVLSIFLLLICLIVLIYIITSWAMGSTVPGWTSISLSIYALFSINFLLIGLQGEYLGKTYFQTLRRPRYIIQEISNNLYND
ncbi:glycosyltransferase family 2 protein [bacterium]|nr:glycosyltransferase family 2 protein [bacterium]